MLAPDAMGIWHEQVRETISKSSPIDGLQVDGVGLGSDTAGKVLSFITVEKADTLLEGFLRRPQ